MQKSLLELAYQTLLSRHENKNRGEVEPIPFRELWEIVKHEAELSEEAAADQIGYFYTNLIFDSRFLSRSNNTWDLRQFFTLQETSENADFYDDDDLEETYDSDEVAPKDLLDISDIDKDVVNSEDEEPRESEFRVDDINEIDI